MLMMLVFILPSSAQNIHFSQIDQTKLYYNPAFAGSDQVTNLMVNHRNYLPASFGNFITYQASYNQKIETIKGGLGMQIINDRQGGGTFNSILGSLIYSYHFQASDNIFLYGGLETKLGYVSVRKKDLIFPDMFNPRSWELSQTNTNENLDTYNGTNLDFSAGILMVYKKYMLRTFREFSVGFSIQHLNKPASILSQENSRISRTYNLFFDIDIPLMGKKKLSEAPVLTPALLFRGHGSSLMLQYGSILSNKGLDMGIFIRHDQRFQFIDLIFQAGVELSNFSIHYSYDSSFLSKMKKNLISGAHEVTLGIHFQYKGKK